jgi:cytidyltransferase-like protein
MIKLFKINEIIKKIPVLKKNKKKIGLLNGVFDVIHHGHILHFEDAKKKCDYLILSITGDKFVNKGPNKPYFNIEQRIKMLSSISYINAIIVNDDINAVNIIKKIKPTFFIKGSDYSNFQKDITGNILKEKKAVVSVKGSLLITKTELFSSSKIIREKFNFLNDDFKKLFKFDEKTKLKKKIEVNFEKKLNDKILIIGEPIIDVNSFVEFLGRGSKSNIISTHHLFDQYINGGSFLVANTLGNFFRNATIALPYNKWVGKICKKALNKNIKIQKIDSKNFKIVIKKRFVDNYRKNKLFQINKNDYHDWDLENKKKFNAKILNLIKNNKYDKIIIFDYGHGLITNNLIDNLNKLKSKLFINCQSNSSNFGFNSVTKYKGGKAICMDELEFRLISNDRKTPIPELIKNNWNFIKKFSNFIITLGKNGCYIISNNKKTFVPTIYKNLDNTIGCGDVFFSMYATINTMNKFNNKEVGFLSHLAAGMHAENSYNPKLVHPRSIIKVSKTLLD